MGPTVGRVTAAVAAALALAVSAAACGMGPAYSGRAGSGTAPAAPARTGVPELRVDVVARGLTEVTDVGPLPDGRLIATQRKGTFTLLGSNAPGAAVSPIAADLGDVYTRGEGGLLGIAVHPDFAKSRRFTTCQTHAERGTPTDVRLVTWELDTTGKSARRVVDPLVGGLPIGTQGQHLTCRPTVAPDGALLVGTGDAARGTVPQDQTSLGGKILRVDLATGGPSLGNPFQSEPNPAQRLVLTYGHTDVVGVTIDPKSGSAYAAEVGNRTDDEVNLIVPGKNYGFDPTRGGTNYTGYDRTVPMTDTVHYPDAQRPVWVSGAPTPGVSGAAFLQGPQWGDLANRLAVSTFDGKKLLLMAIGPDGKVTDTTTPAPLDNTFGQLSNVRVAPSGDMYLTTANGTDDQVLRVVPV